MNSKLLLGIGVIILVVAAILALGGNVNKTQAPQSQSAPQQNEPPQTVNVSVESSGFSPATLTVKAGSKVEWVNNSGSDISINSDEHPTHQLYPELNLGHIPNGSSTSLVFNKPGTYTYHDHYNPDRTGTVIME